MLSSGLLPSRYRRYALCGLAVGAAVLGAVQLLVVRRRLGKSKSQQSSQKSRKASKGRNVSKGSDARARSGSSELRSAEKAGDLQAEVAQLHQQLREGREAWKNQEAQLQESLTQRTEELRQLLLSSVTTAAAAACCDIFTPASGSTRSLLAVPGVQPKLDSGGMPPRVTTGEQRQFSNIRVPNFELQINFDQREAGLIETLLGQYPALAQLTTEDLLQRVAIYDVRGVLLPSRRDAKLLRAEDAYPLTARFAEPQVRVANPRLRAVRLGDLLRFFEARCGDIAYEDGELGMLPLCMPTKLARLCNRHNVRAAQLAGGKKFLELQPNMYAVESLLLRPLTEPERVSAAELWSTEGAPIEIFVSHYWGQDFGEFVQSIYRFALRHFRGLHPRAALPEIWERALSTGLYVCAFSNNQWNLSCEMGGKIEDSPFYKVLKADTTTTVVMNLDQMAASLLRAWCDFEFYFSHVLRKSLVLNSRFGPLRRLGCSSDCGKVAELWMLHVFELLQDVDINLATATREEDLELIRSEIASFVGTGVAEGLRGADALNRLLKSMIASEVLPALARIGDLSALHQALANGADVEAADHRDIRPLTYAAAIHGPESPAVQLLLERGADPTAVAHAEHILRLFHEDSAKRKAALTQITAMLTPAQRKFHKTTLSVARQQHAAHCRSVLEALAQLGEEAPPFAKNIADRLCVPDDNSNASAVPSAVPTPRGGLPVIRTPEAPQSPREGDAAIASSRLHSPRIDGDEKWSVTVQEAAAVLLHQSQPGAKPKARDNMLDPDSPISQNSTAIRGNFTPVGRLKGLSKLEARAARQKRQMRPPEIQVSSRASSAAGSQGLHSSALGSRAASKAPSLGAASSSPEKENLAFSRQTSVASASQGMQKPPVDAEELGERRASGSQGSQTPVEGLPLSRSHSRSSQGNQTPVGGFPQLFSRTSSRSSTKLLELKGTSCSSLGGRAASSTQYNMPVVMEHLESEDSGLRMAACEVLLDLGKTAAAQALPQLSELLEDRCDGVRRAALGVMAQMGCETLEAEHVEKMAELLNDEHEEVREAACRALAFLGEGADKTQLQEISGTVADALASKLGDEESEVRDAAMQALATLAPESTASHADAIRQRLVDSEESDEMRISALGVLSQLKDAGGLTSHLSSIAECLEDDNWRVREAACEAIAELGEDAGEHAGALAEMLMDEDGDVREAACAALGALGGAAHEHVGTIAERLNDCDVEVRSAAVAALGQLGEAAAPHAAEIMECLTDQSIEVRRQACAALGAIGDVTTCEALGSCLKDLDDGVREAAVDALAELANGSEDLRTQISTSSFGQLETLRRPSASPLGQQESELRSKCALITDAAPAPAMSRQLSGSSAPAFRRELSGNSAASKGHPSRAGRTPTGGLEKERETRSGGWQRVRAHMLRKSRDG